jgi:hypothetical protein
MQYRASNRRTLVAVGFTTEKGHKQVCIHLEPSMFEELKMRAIKNCRSIRSQIRDYIEMGLSVDCEMEADAATDPLIAEQRGEK